MRNWPASPWGQGSGLQPQAPHFPLFILSTCGPASRLLTSLLTRRPELPSASRQTTLCPGRPPCVIKYHSSRAWCQHRRLRWSSLQKADVLGGQRPSRAGSQQEAGAPTGREAPGCCLPGLCGRTRGLRRACEGASFRRQLCSPFGLFVSWRTLGTCRLSARQ